MTEEQKVMFVLAGYKIPNLCSQRLDGRSGKRILCTHVARGDKRFDYPHVLCLCCYNALKDTNPSWTFGDVEIYSDCEGNLI